MVQEKEEKPGEKGKGEGTRETGDSPNESSTRPEKSFGKIKNVFKSMSSEEDGEVPFPGNAESSGGKTPDPDNSSKADEGIKEVAEEKKGNKIAADDGAELKEGKKEGAERDISKTISEIKDRLKAKKAALKGDGKQEKDYKIKIGKAASGIKDVIKSRIKPRKLTGTSHHKQSHRGLIWGIVIFLVSLMGAVVIGGIFLDGIPNIIMGLVGTTLIIGMAYLVGTTLQDRRKKETLKGDGKPPEDPGDSYQKRDNLGQIVGIVVAVFFLLSLIAVLVIGFIWTRRENPPGIGLAVITVIGLGLIVGLFYLAAITLLKDKKLGTDYTLGLKPVAFVFVITGLAISVGLGMEIRMEAGDLGFTYVQAQNYVDGLVVESISRSIDQNHPNLPDRNKQLLIAEEFLKVRESDEYKQRVEDISAIYKNFFQDDKGRNYMPDIDSYYWLRYARNVVETGKVGNEVRNGVEWDSLQLAPTGRVIAPQDTFYPKSIAFFHKTATVFAGLPFMKFTGDTELIRVLMFYPVFISMLTIVIVFMLTRRMAGNIAAFFAATIFAVHPVLLRRTMFGHGDSDAIVVFFSVFVLWLFVEAFTARKMARKLVFAGLSGLASGLYSLTWGGWWWIFDFVMVASTGTLVAFIIYDTILRTVRGEGNPFVKSIKSKISTGIMLAIAVYFCVTGLFVTIFWGIKTFLLTPLASLGFTAIKDPVTGSASPNVLRTVAELNEGTVWQAIDQIGPALFLIAMLGIAFIALRAAFVAAGGLVETSERYGPAGGMVKKAAATSAAAASHAYKKSDKNRIINDIFYAAVLAMWIAATMYSVTKGIRFTLLIVPAFSIAFGVFFGMQVKFSRWFSGFITQELKLDRITGFVFIPVTLLVVMLILVPLNVSLFSNLIGSSLSDDIGYVKEATKAVPASDVPIMNDAWHNALTTIKENSEKNAIITSWWDFGHQFRAIAERSVTFDGATQDTPQAHWVGRFFSTDNETEAVGILRMLDCGGSQGTDKIAEGLDRIKGDSNADYKDQTVEAVKFTKRIIIMSREEAETALTDAGFSPTEAYQILEFTHCHPPEAFVIASNDMIGKAGVWGHFGGWNYTRADIWRSARDLPRQEAVEYMKDRHGINEELADTIFLDMQTRTDDAAADAWISPWPSIAGGMQACSRQNEIVRCENGITVNLTDMETMISTQGGNRHPASIVYLNETELVEKKYDSNTLPELSVLLVPDGETFSVLLADPKLVDGMFVRMFFLDGHGLKHFRLFTKKSGFGTEIGVWQVDWEGQQENLLRELQEKTEVDPGSKVTVKYIGYLENGTVFDSSISEYRAKNVTKDTLLDGSQDHNDFTFTLGIDPIIPEFENGVLEARIGEEKTFTISPEEGYLDPTHALFNKTLIFRIKVVGIE